MYFWGTKYRLVLRSKWAFVNFYTLNLLSGFSCCIMILMVNVSTTVFITQGNYYMFRLLSSNLQAYSLQVKSQDAVHTLGSQCVHSIL